VVRVAWLTVLLAPCCCRNGFGSLLAGGTPESVRPYRVMLKVALATQCHTSPLWLVFCRPLGLSELLFIERAIRICRESLGWMDPNGWKLLGFFHHFFKLPRSMNKNWRHRDLDSGPSVCRIPTLRSRIPNITFDHSFHN